MRGPIPSVAVLLWAVGAVGAVNLEIAYNDTRLLVAAEATVRQQAVVYAGCEYVRRAEGAKTHRSAVCRKLCSSPPLVEWKRRFCGAVCRVRGGVVVGRCTECLETAVLPVEEGVSMVRGMLEGAGDSVRAEVEAVLEDAGSATGLLRELVQLGEGLVGCTSLHHTRRSEDLQTFEDQACCEGMVSLLEHPEEVPRVVGLPLAGLGLTHIPAVPFMLYSPTEYAVKMGEWVQLLGEVKFKKLFDTRCDSDFGTRAGAQCPCLESYCRPVRMPNSPGDLSAFKAAGAAVEEARRRDPNATEAELQAVFGRTYAAVKPAMAGKEEFPAFFWTLVAGDAAMLTAVAGVPEPYATRFAAVYGSLAVPDAYWLHTLVMPGAHLHLTGLADPEGAAAADLRGLLEDADKATEGLAEWLHTEHGVFNFPLALVRVRGGCQRAHYRRMFREGWKALRGKTLYALDLTMYEPSDLHEQWWSPGLVVLLVLERGKGLVPVAVRLSSASAAEGDGDGEEEVFWRGVEGVAAATDSAWVLALAGARATLTNFGITLGHIARYHFPNGAVSMAVLNNAGEEWPLRPLLDRHLKYTGQFNTILLASYDPVFPPVAVRHNRLDFLRLHDEFFASRGQRLASFNPRVYLKEQGVRAEDFTSPGGVPWDLFPSIGEELRMWDICEEYVSAWVDALYKSDREVRTDRTLQRVVAELTHPSKGNLFSLHSTRKGDGCRVVSRAALAEVLTQVVFNAMQHGLARLDSVVASTIASVPHLTGKEMIRPHATYTLQEIMGRMPRLAGLGRYVSFLSSFRLPPSSSLFPNGTVSDADDAWTGRPELDEASRTFRHRIVDLITTDHTGTNRMLGPLPLTKDHPSFAAQLKQFPSSVEL